MRLIANCLATTSLVLVTAFADAGNGRRSRCDIVHRCRHRLSRWRERHPHHPLDLPSGDNTLVAKDFPLTLDPSSLRVEGEGARGSRSARSIRGTPKPVLPGQSVGDRQAIEALKDQRADLDGAIASAEARRKFAERFAEASPAGLGEKGEARPLSEWRAAFAAVAEEVASADTAIRDAQRKQRDIDREIARLEQERNVKPPSKLEVRIDLAAAAATKATLRVTYTVRNARWTPLYDARLDTGAKDRKPALELVRRAEITQATGEDWSNVTLGVSTVRVARGGDAPDLNSLVVRYPVPARPTMQRGERRCEASGCRCAPRSSPGARADGPHGQLARTSAPRSSRPPPRSAPSRPPSRFPAASASVQAGRQEPAHRQRDALRPI